MEMNQRMGESLEFGVQRSGFASRFVGSASADAFLPTRKNASAEADPTCIHSKPNAPRSSTARRPIGERSFASAQDDRRAGADRTRAAVQVYGAGSGESIRRL